MRVRPRLLVNVGVSVALLAIILISVGDIKTVGRLLLDAAPLYVLLAVLLLVVDRFLMTFKWLLLLKSRGLDVPLVQGVKIYCSAMVWGLFLPATIGADAIRGYLTSRRGLDGYAVYASIAVERLVGFISALFVGLVGIVILSSVGASDERLAALWWSGGIATSLAVLALLLSFHEGLFERSIRLLPQRMRGSRTVQRVEQFHAAYRAYADNRSVLGAFFVLTLVEQACVVLAIWVMALALHIDVSVLFMAGAVTVTLLISRLPVSIDGIGVFEGVFVLVLGLAGVSAAEAVALSLAGRVIQLGVWLPFWLTYTFETGTVRPPKNAVPSSG